MRRFAILAILLATFLSATLTRGQTYTVLHTFTGLDGNSPLAGLFRDSAGNLYGTTFYGGAFGSGTVFKIDTSNNETVLHSFAGGTDGANPYGTVIRDSAGDLYGTASGRVFKLDASNHFSLLAPEVGGSLGDLSFCFSGEICGTDFEASVWRITKSGENFIILYDFPTYYDGSMLEGGVVQNAAGDLFGVASCCGQGDSGVIYEVTKAGLGKTLYALDGDADGAYPQGNLVLDKAGNIFGTTSAGGDLSCSGFAYGCGVVYKFTPGVGP